MPARPLQRWQLVRDRFDAAACAVIIVVAGLIVLPNYPGRINADVWSMLSQVRSGQIADWHAPLVQEVWRLVDPILSVGVLYVIQTVALVGCTWLLFRRRLTKPIAAFGVAFIWLNPLGYAFAANFTRDVWMVTGFLIAASAASKMSHAPFRGRPVFVSFAIAGSLLSLASRQNAIALLFPLFFLAGWAIVDRRKVLGGLVCSIALALLWLVASNVAISALGVLRTGPETPIMLSDLDEYSEYIGRVAIPPSASSPGLTLDDLHRLSSVYNPDVLWFGPQEARVYVQLPPAARADVRQAWRQMIVDHPGRWLSIRTKLFLRQIGVSGPTRNVSLPAQIENTVGISARFADMSERASSYLSLISTQTVAGRWLTRFIVWFAVALGVTLARRRRYEIIVLVGCTGYVTTYFPAATDLQYRFVSPAIVLLSGTIVLSGLQVAESLVSRRWGRGLEVEVEHGGEEARENLERTEDEQVHGDDSSSSDMNSIQVPKV